MFNWRPAGHRDIHKQDTHACKATFTKLSQFSIIDLASSSRSFSIRSEYLYPSPRPQVNISEHSETTRGQEKNKHMFMGLLDTCGGYEVH